MQLNAKDQQRKDRFDQQIKKVNLDMTILNGISGKNVLPQGTGQKAGSLTLNQLAHVLRNKNDRSAHLQADKYYVKEWLKSKGVNIKKINEEIRQNARVSAELGIFFEPKQPISKPMGLSALRKQLSTVSLKQPTPAFTCDIQSQFINKQKQVTIYKQISKSMKQSKAKNNFRNTLVNKLKQLMPSNQGNKYVQAQMNNQILVMPGDERVVNDETKKNEYFDFVESLVKNGWIESNKKLKNVRPFWKIVLKHIESIHHYKPLLQNQKQKYHDKGRKDPAQLRLNERLMYKSLTMIEHQFSKSLPETSRSYEKLDEIIKNMQRRNRRLKVWRNSNGQPSWARAFMLLRAGRKEQVKRVIQNVDRQFLNQFIAHQESLTKHPTPSFIKHEVSKYKDSFYTQLLYILQGSQKFQPQILQEDDTLTKTWLMLRTISIYRSNAKYEAICMNIGKSISEMQIESKGPLTSATIESYLHLGFYKYLIHLVEMVLVDGTSSKELQGFDYDDYFHLLLIVRLFPELWGDASENERTGIQAKFTKQLLEYMQRLRNEGFYKQTAKYLMLALENVIQKPKNDLIEAASKFIAEFITTREQFEQFDWETFKQILRLRCALHADQIFIQVSKKVLDKLKLKTFSDFFYTANLYKSTFAQSRDSSLLEQKCYVKLLLGHLFYVQKKRYLVRRGQLSPEFTQEMFGFFGIRGEDANNQKQLQRIDSEVNARVRECEVMLSGLVDMDRNDPQYLLKVVQPYTFYQTVSDLASMLQNPTFNYERLKQFDNTQMYKHLDSNVKPLQHILNLLEFFRSQYSKPITPLYIFYLNMLIERKRMITTKEYDYSGLPSYIEGILKNLQSLDLLSRKRLQHITFKQLSFEGSRNKTIEMSQNQLNKTQEYREFMQGMYEYLRQYGGSYGMGLTGINGGRLSERTTGLVV